MHIEKYIPHTYRCTTIIKPCLYALSLLLSSGACGIPGQTEQRTESVQTICIGMGSTKFSPQARDIQTTFLSTCPLGSDTVDQFFQQTGWEKVQSLSIDTRTIFQKGGQTMVVKRFAQASPRLRNLEQLKLFIQNDNHDVGNQQVANAIANSLAMLPKLTNLELGWADFTIADIQVIAQGISNCPKLTHLHLTNNGIGSHDTKALAQIFSNCPNLVYLDLNSNKIEAEGAKVIAQALKNCPKLAHLDLSSNKIATEGAKVIAQVLKHCPKLAHLDLSSNKIETAGAKIIAQALNNCPKIEYLSLSRNKIEAEGVKGLTQTLRNFHNLMYLWLDFINIGDAVMQLLAEAIITHCSNLHLLDLHGVEIGDQGAQAIAKIIMNCPNLTYIGCGRNNFGRVGKQAVGQCRTKRPNLLINW